MAAISTWSKTAASNNSTPPDGWPEGMNPSAVNDTAREMMAALRTRFEDLEWFNHGHVLVQQSTNSFLVSSTCTQVYTAGRRLKLYDSTTIYGEVIASSPSGANTLVTVSSSTLLASLSSGEVGIINPANLSFPVATNAQQEAVTGDVVVTPWNQHWHPSAAKAWVNGNFAGAAQASYNLTSITDGGTGVVTVTIATDLSSVNYAAVATIEAGAAALYALVRTMAAGSFVVISADNAGIVADGDAFHAVVYGDI